MKTVILAGGLGTRLAEETSTRPKPMVEIGGQPMLWHIMQIYAAHGFSDFLIAAGFKSHVIKDFFRNFHLYHSDLVVDLRTGAVETANSSAPPWRIAVVDTGLNTMTGGRLKRLAHHIGQATFMATYGDGVADVNLKQVLEFHRSHGKLATVTAVRPPARFGGLVLDHARVVEFTEKSQLREGWINGGFFVFEPAVLNYIQDDTTILERDPLERLAADGQLMAHLHEGFWQPMDTLREKQQLEALWSSGRAPWKIWN